MSLDEFLKEKTKENQFEIHPRMAVEVGIKYCMISLCDVKQSRWSILRNVVYIWEVIKLLHNMIQWIVWENKIVEYFRNTSTDSTVISWNFDSRKFDEDEVFYYKDIIIQIIQPKVSRSLQISN